MIELLVNDQELFEIIMALHAFEKSSAVPPSDSGEREEFEDLARRRHDLLDKLHDVFDEAVVKPFRQSTGTPEPLLLQRRPRQRRQARRAFRAVSRSRSTSEDAADIAGA